MVSKSIAARREWYWIESPNNHFEVDEKMFRFQMKTNAPRLLVMKKKEKAPLATELGGFSVRNRWIGGSPTRCFRPPFKTERCWCQNRASRQVWAKRRHASWHLYSRARLSCALTKECHAACVIPLDRNDVWSPNAAERARSEKFAFSSLRHR